MYRPLPPEFADYAMQCFSFVCRREIPEYRSNSGFGLSGLMGGLSALLLVLAFTHGENAYSQSVDDIFSAGFEAAPNVPYLGAGPCVAQSGGADYQVGPGAGQLQTLAQVPWESLQAGDTVRIFYRAQPYTGKLAINAMGTATAPVRVCGVKGPNGERPVIDGSGATSRPTMSFGRDSASVTNQERGIIFIVARGSADWGTMTPSYIVIDGLKLQRAHPNYGFMRMDGTADTYSDFGACIWLEQGHHITIADNEITDCSEAIFSRSSDDGDGFLTKDVRISGNNMYGNGIAGDDHMHTTYIQSVGVTYEFNRYGPLRPGALGNSIKDRSVGAVVRYNRIEAGAYAVDLVEAQDYTNYAASDPAYHLAYVYGNQIVKDGPLVMHYGGDHEGSEAGYRKGTLYFYNNTVYTHYGDSIGVYLFRLSTTDEHAAVWNNVFVFDTDIQYPSMRTDQAVAPGYVSGGILDLGVNWINNDWGDTDPWHPVGGELNGSANMVEGPPSPVDLTTMIPLANGPAVDTAQAQLPDVDAYPVDYELDALTLMPRPRPVNGTAMDLGAVER